MALKSSEKGDNKEVKKVEGEEVQGESPKNVQTAVNFEDLDQGTMLKLLFELKGELAELKAKETRNFEEDEEYDLLEDYLEVPAVFFCFSQEFNVHADVRQGRESLPPLGFVKFKPLYRYHRKNSRGVDVIAVSQCIIRSKAQSDWLRRHTRFGIKFFENIDDVKSVNTVLAEKMSEYSGMVSRMSDHQVIQRAQQITLPVHSDIEQLRKELIQKLAEKDILASKKKQDDFFAAERDDDDRIIIDKTGKEKAKKEVRTDVY
jgi:hypothetical protein